MNSEGYRGSIPFEPLRLTYEEQERCQELTLQLLDRILRSYDERNAISHGSPRHHSNLDSARWKRHKTQANASLYSERGHGVQRDLQLPGDNWESPAVLLAVGTIQGSLEDVMLGLVTQTFGEMRVRAASIASHDVSGATLAKLSGPVEEDPFQNLSVQWMVGEQGWPLNMIVRPRDFVNLVASGVITRANGDRIGYDLVQPAPLPQCSPLPKPMTRGKLMYGALYRDNRDGTVDVYIQLYVETMGHILDTIVMNAMWIASLGFWEAPRLAQEKKLQWCILNRMKNPNSRRHRSTWADIPRCDICQEKVRKHSRGRHQLPGPTHSCAMCAMVLCSRCRVKRSFKVLTGAKKGPPTRSVHVVVCPSCLDFAHDLSAVDIAWQQHQQRLVQSETDSAASSRLTWGLLEDVETPSWMPGRQLSMSEYSFSYSDKGDAGSVYSAP